MSYARFGWNNSDVYIFTTRTSTNPDQYAIDCCGCMLDEGEPLEAPYKDMFGIEHTHAYYGFKAQTSGEMLRHLKEHRDAGHNITKETIQDILRDYPDQSKPITEYEQEKQQNKGNIQ